jgi:hypothetical protein
LAQELDWHPRLQLFLASLLESKERRYTDDSEVPIALNLRINHTPAPRAASEQPIRLVDAGAYRSGLLIHDDIKASGDKARLLGFSVEALTLDGNHDADLSEALRFVEYCDLRDLEQLHLRGRVGLEAVLDDIFTRWALWAPLKRFTDLRLQCVLTADVVDALEGALKEIGPQLRTFHLQPSDDAWIPRHLLDNLDRLELLALNTRSCAFLFDQGRLPRLKYLFLGQPKQRGSIMDPLLTARSRLLYKERIDDIFKHVATSGRRLHVGLWQLSFKLMCVSSLSYSTAQQDPDQSPNRSRQRAQELTPRPACARPAQGLWPYPRRPLRARASARVGRLPRSLMPFAHCRSHISGPVL